MRSRSPRRRRYSRSSSRSDSYHYRRRRSPSYERHRDKYYSSRSRRSPRRGGISNPPPDHPDHNPGNNIYISNLATSISETQLKEHFSRFGEITEVRIITDPFTKASRGFGFVTFSTDEEAEKAISGMNGEDLEGKVVVVEKARRSRPHDSTPGTYCGPVGASSKYRRHRSRRSPSPLRRRRKSRSYS